VKPKNKRNFPLGGEQKTTTTSRHFDFICSFAAKEQRTREKENFWLKFPLANFLQSQTNVVIVCGGGSGMDGVRNDFEHFRACVDFFKVIFL
jgi:hypothetical protein